MRSNKKEIVVLFAACGLFFGLLTVLVAFVAPYVVWFGVGVFFFLALATGFVIGRINKWFSFPRSLWRYIVSSLTIVSAYPLAFVSIFVGAEVYRSFYFMLLGWRGSVSTRGDPYLHEAFLIGLLIAVLIGALLVSMALKIITQKWDKMAMLLMLLAGIITIPICTIINTLFSISDGFLTLFPVGELLFSGVSGYWLQRTIPVSHHNR